MPVILIAENETVIRLDMAAILEERGHEIIAVDCAEDAMAFLAVRPDISVLIASINLRGAGNGVELMAEAKELNPGIRLIIATSRTKGEVGDLPYEVIYLAKPSAKTSLRPLSRLH